MVNAAMGIFFLRYVMTWGKMEGQEDPRRHSKEVCTSASRIKGRKRPKYQNPWREHPETTRPMAETDIHANHAEAFFSALRRKCATFRRKTNMYAKSTKLGLQVFSG